jgi:adenylate cyclase
MAQGLDWAFCAPVPGEACAGWGLYVAGSFAAGGGSESDLRPDVKFTELVADMLGAVQDLKGLKHRQTMLGRFFSPVTLPLLSKAGGEQALDPRKTQVTVLFCDLRGFSREAERSRDDLLGLLERVSNALDVMTESIHSHRGVVGDFQGDAALAFWGWPIDDGKAAADACRAALDIRMRFLEAAREGEALEGFACGIGIASGEAVAGRLGTAAQFKIDVFGPVVNLASRLEGITKQVRVPLLLDGETARRAMASGEANWARFRRLARIRPYGMAQAVTVSELLPPSGEEVLTDDDVRQYEQALEAFVAGSWDDAFALLHDVPYWDRGKDFLTSYILRHNRQCPPDWDGVIAIESK